MAQYNGLIKYLNECYENSTNPHNYVDDLKKMEKASSIEKTLKLFDLIVHDNQWNYSWSYGSRYVSQLYQIINENILRLFKECSEPDEKYLLKCLINLRGDYSQAAEFLIKEATNNKGLEVAEAHAHEAISVKRKYENAWEQIKGRPENSNGAIKIIVEIAPLLDMMNNYGYIHTKSETERISDYGLNKKNETLRYVLGAIAFIAFMVVFWWLLDGFGIGWVLAILLLLVWLKG